MYVAQLFPGVEPVGLTNLRAVSYFCEEPLNRLYEHFSRDKRKYYVGHTYTIWKLDVQKFDLKWWDGKQDSLKPQIKHS